MNFSRYCFVCCVCDLVLKTIEKLSYWLGINTKNGGTMKSWYSLKTLKELNY